jgi:galactose mutarotase-like enzyme
MWKVMNQGDDKMYFQIGAHPAFYCPINQGEERSSYQIDFHTEEQITYSLISKNGVLERDSYPLDLKNGLLAITNELFDKDALVFENPNTKRISLVDPNGRHYVTVSYDAPVVGVWSPAGKVAPFVCIEPWYGRCDAEDFSGSLADREWINTLDRNEQFTASYQIIIN